MRSYLIPVLIAFLLLIGCSGEGYIEVNNNTPSSIMVSVNNAADEVVLAGDTSQTYNVAVMKGVANNISVDATGEWVGNYTGTVSLTDGATIVHRINPQVADLTITNLSVDSANCVIENYDTLFFDGDDSQTGKFTVDGSVVVGYAGRYMFYETETMNWFPGSTYSYELVPNACEIQLNNIHPTWTIYYVYLSQSTDTDFDLDNDNLGDDVIESGYGYVWKATGDIGWDVRVLAGDPHPDSLLYAYDYYDTGICTSDVVWGYEFPTIFDAVQVAKIAKTDISKLTNIKSGSLNKVNNMSIEPTRIEKIRKVDAGKAGLKALRK